MAADNISNFYNAFSKKYNDFATEDDFRGWLGNAKRADVDNLYGAFSKKYNDFGSADDMISYLGWSEMTDEERQAAAEKQAEAQHQQDAAAGREMWNRQRASRQAPVSSVEQAPERAKAAMAESAPAVKQTEEEEEWVPEENEWKSYFREMREQVQGGRSTLADAPAEVQEGYAEEEKAKAEEDARPKSLAELMQMREDAAKDYEFVKEYNAQQKEYEEKMRSLSSAKGDIRGKGLADYKEEKDWLDQNRHLYETAKGRVEGIDKQIYRDQVPIAEEERQQLLDANKEALNDLRGHVGLSIRPLGAGTSVADEDWDEYALRNNAQGLLAEAGQVLRQGSKYDPGYEGSEFNQLYTAAKQYVGGFINNADLGSLTLGLTEGLQNSAARKVGEHYNEIINQTLKDLGLTDAQMNALMKDADGAMEKLQPLVEEMQASAAELESMQQTLKDMAASGADRGKIEAYAKQLEQKYDAYDKRYKEEYEPLYATYKKYEDAAKAVQTALDAGLSGGEEAVLDAFNFLAKARELRRDDVSTASKAGAGFEQTVEFMLDFLLTGGFSKAGTKAATKLTMRHLEKKLGKEKFGRLVAEGVLDPKRMTATMAQDIRRGLGKEALEEMAKREVINPSTWSRIVTDPLVAGARTLAMVPRNIATYGEQIAELADRDELGRYNFSRSKLDAALNTLVQNYIEYWSEGFGEYFGAAEQALFRKVTARAPKTLIGQTLKGYRGSIGQFLDHGKFNGQFNETLEEVVGSALNALAGALTYDKETEKSRIGDKEALSQFFAAENLMTLTMSFLPLSAMGAVSNIKAYNKMKTRYDAAVDNLNPLIQSGAVDLKELDGLADDLRGLTPEEATGRMVEMSDKAREKNGGALPKNFVQSVMGYLEGKFAMSMENEAWEANANKIAIVDSYTRGYTAADPSAAWDAAQAENEAKKAALEAGFTEEELDNNSMTLGQQATYLQNTQPDQVERAQALENYAVAKAARESLRDGYDAETDEMNREWADNVRDNLDHGGGITTATININGQYVPVYISGQGVSVTPEGTLTTETGPDGLVIYRTSPTAQPQTAKASAFSNAVNQETEAFIAEKQEAVKRDRDAMYDAEANTVSERGQQEAIAGKVGQTVIVTDGKGVYEPVKVERMREDGTRTVISGDRKFLQGLARRMNMQIPPGSMLDAPTAALYQLLAKEEDGVTLSTQMPEGTERAAEESKPQQGEAPAVDVKGLRDQDVTINLGGQERSVHVDDVRDGTVYFSDENGNDSQMSEADFAASLQGTQAPVAEEPAPAPAQAQAPAAQQGEAPAPAPAAPAVEIPTDKKTGEKIYDAPGVAVQDALNDLYATEGLSEADVDQYIAERAAETEAARNPERGKMSPQAWGQAKKEAARVADFWAAMAKAAQERKEQPAEPAQAEAPAAPAQAETPAAEAPEAEAPVAEEPAEPAQEAAEGEEVEAQEPTREALKPYKKFVSRAKKWEKRTGIKVRFFTSIDEVDDKDAREALERGEEIGGWYDPKTGGVGVYLPYNPNLAELDKTIVHEVVSHKGLRGLLGEEGYNQLLDRVWNEMMSPSQRKKFLDYNSHLRGSEEYLRRAAADEFIAQLSENVDFSDNRTMFEKIVDYIADWFKEHFGNETPLTEEEIVEDAKARVDESRRINRNVLTNLLVDSMKLYETRTKQGKQDAETKREIGAGMTGGAMQTNEGETGQTKFSIKSIATGGGLHVIEDNGRGMVAFTTDDGRVFDAENPITAEDLQDLDNTVMAYMMEDARDITGITPEQEEVLWQAYAAQLNAFLAKGVPGDGLSGADRLKALWQWEVENSVYKSVSPNGDKQYSYSMDITRVCKKNEAVIKAISAMQSEVGYGITPGQIMDIYLQGVEEGYQVPCPVCYVFSHYINNGIVATVAIRGQEKYGADLVDPSTLSEEEKAERIQMWYDRMKEERKFNEDNADEIENARQECATIIEQIDLLSQLITSGRLRGEAAKKAIRRVKDLDNRFRSALALYTQAGQAGWIKQFAIREAKKGEKGFVPKGQPKGKKGEAPKEYVLWDDTFQGFPKENALDLTLTAETIEKYPAIQRLRNARGSAGGKEIHFASNNDIGDIPMMLGTKDGENYYQQAVLAGPGPERDRLRKAARERFASAHRYAQQQSLRGGQRMWSWSDNIERLAPDVFVNLMQLQMLGGALQAYSKQLEGVNLVASMGGYVNGSLMGYGKGWQELKDDDIETLPDGSMVLKKNIKDKVTEVVDGKRVERDRFLAKAGAPVFKVMDQGVEKKVTLLFDDVVGIDAYGRERDGKHLKGLFDLNAELDKAGNILVGMNDPHVRAAMADPRVFFIIPWHASGNSVHIVQQMLSYLGVDTDIKDYTDYTDVQEEKDLMGKEVSDYVARFWEDTFQNGGKDFACGIEEGIPSGKDGKLSPEQEHYRELRDAIFLGVKYDTGKTKTVKGKKQKVYETISIRDLADLVARIEAKKEKMPAWMKSDERKLETWPAQIMNDAFLSQVLRKVGDRVDEKKMTSTDRGFIYPYEYWDESSTYDTADVNGGRYLEYCRRLGVKPKFVGMLDGRPAENDRGNFAGDKGYWKLLIDRRMYGLDGKFQDLDPVTTSGYDTKFVDPEWTEDTFTKTRVADDKGAKRIADKVIEKEGIKFKEGGGIPLVNYGSGRKEDLRRYKALMAATKRIGIDDLVAMATPEAAVSSANEGAEADPQTTEGKGLMYRRRTEEPPKERQKVYKLMRLGDDGKLYPLFIDSGSPIELKEWWDADSPALKDVETLPSDTYVGKRDVKDKDGNKIGEEEYRYASYIVDNETGEAMSIADFKAAHKGEKAFSRMQGTPNKDAINWATENGMRWIRIEEKKTAQKRYGGSNRAYYNYGINGSNAVGTYAMRPGWHAGSLPSMRQIGKGKGKNLRDDSFVWVEGYVPADIDYNEEAQGNPDKDIPTHIPENGYYLKATNANAEASQADRIGWYVAGSFYPERIMSDSEARAVIDEWNTEHPDEKVEYDWPRESGKVFNAETMQLEDSSQSRYRRITPEQDAEYMDAVNAGDMEKARQMVRDAFKAAFPNTKVVDENGEPRLMYHGSAETFTEFITKTGSEGDLGDGTYFTSDKALAESYMKRNGDNEWRIDSAIEEYFDEHPEKNIQDEADFKEAEKWAEENAFKNAKLYPVFINLENPRYVSVGDFKDGFGGKVIGEDFDDYQHGYDGLIDDTFHERFPDFVPEGAIQVVAFEPNQIKSADPVTYDDNGNVIPLSERFNPESNDIRFRRASELELDEDTKKLFDAAKERFGTTRDLREAGYVLPDGTMLDFSGRHWAKGTDTSYLNGGRQVDHREIADLEFEEDGNTPTGIETSMSDFIRRGAIRINYPGSINLANQPTMEQASVLERLINADNSFVRVDFGDGSRSQHYADYEDARAQRILNDIRRYFDEGVKPEGTTFSRFRRATTPEQRIEEAERIMAGKIVDAMGETFGVKTNRVPRSRMPKGHETEKGYYDPSTNELTVCMENVTDERDAVATAIHETVGHNGLSEIFGDEFNQAMVRVYASLDRDGRNWVNAYIATHGLGFGDEGVIRGMEEYLSRMAEAADYGQPVWEQINDVISKSVDLLFGTDGFFFTDRELNYVLRAAYQHAKNPNWLETTRGKALDRKMRRELGINETDPKRPTDPDGPDAGVRYRRMDTGDAAYDYDQRMKDWRVTARMEFQDADLPVRIGMEKIMKETGKTTLAEDEDFITRHNQSSSRADTEAHDFKLHHFEPLMAKVMEIQARMVGMKKDRKGRYRSRGISENELLDAYDRVMDYMYAVSGLERNEWERAHGGEAKDWSGITSLMGKKKDEWREAEDDARAMIDAFKAELGDDSLLDELWDAVRDCTDYSLDHALEYGLITKSQYDELHGTDTKPRMWEYYLPLRGFKEGTAEEEYNYSSFGNVTKNGEVVKDAKGRWTEAENPLANIFNIALSEIVQGNENRAKYALYNFVQRTGENSLLAVVKPWYVRNTEDGGWKPAYPHDGESIEDFESRMEEAKGRGDAIQPKRELKLDKFVNPMHRPQHIIKLKIGGVDKAIMVKGNPAFAKAVMHSYSSSDSIRWLRSASRVISNMFTTYSINFAGKNLMRDTIYSMVSRNIKEDRHYRKTYARNWRRNFGLPMVRLAKEWESGELQRKTSLTPREQMFIDFMHDGGQTGYTVIRSVKDIVKDLERQVKHAGKRSIFRDADGKIIIPGLTHYARLVSTLNEGFELLTRFTTYQTSREMGRSGQSAASDAKEVSVNFNRRGMQSGEGGWGGLAAYLGASHYFFNAGVQGFENFLRLFKIDPPKMTATTAAYALLGMVTPLVNSLIQGALGGDGDDDDDVDEEMREKRKEWDKDWYWNVPDWARRQSIILGFKKFYFAIPLPVELRAFYGIGDVTAKAFLYNKMARRTADHVALEYIQAASEILPVNPVEGIGQVQDVGDLQGWTNVIGRVVAPDITMFAVDFATNRDYTGRPLAKDNPFSKTTPRSQSAYASTPKVIEDACLWIAKQGGPDMPPGYVRDFLNSFGGGLYRTAEDFAKLTIRDADRPFRWDNIPFFSGFTGHIDEDRSNSFALDALKDYSRISDKVVRDINKKSGQSFSTEMVYGNPDILLNRIPSVIDKAAVKKIIDSKDYQIGKAYREYQNNKKKRVQFVRGPKAGQWHDGKEVERVGFETLRRAWKESLRYWYELPKGSPEKADAYADLQTAWQKYYDATMNAADALMDMEFGEE